MNCHPSPRRASDAMHSFCGARDLLFYGNVKNRSLRPQHLREPVSRISRRYEGMTIQFGATARAAALEEARRAALKLMSVLNQ
jgi:hypothetical protein